MLEFVNVAHGEILNHRKGVESKDGLRIPVIGLARATDKVCVNGAPAARCGESFRAEVTLKKRFNTITLRADGNHGVAVREIRVVWDKGSFKRYNFFFDDNSFFWTEIVRKTPASLFDQFYLAFLRRMHERYGTKFTLNLFYRNDHDFCELKSFPDRYKGEFRDNADWLRLSWHAYSEFPDRPYQNAPAEKVAADYDLIREEVCRFAAKTGFDGIEWAVRPKRGHILPENVRRDLPLAAAAAHRRSKPIAVNDREKR